MTPRQVEIVRRRVLHTINPTTAAYGGMSVENLQQFIAHMVFPSDEQLLSLARHLGVADKIQ
jgi:hypothetical protein